MDTPRTIEKRDDPTRRDEPSGSSRRRLQGVVVSDKMQKTVIVRVDRVAIHSKYGKRYAVSKRFKAHDEKREYHPGDAVIIEETRPLSRDKRWRVVGKVELKK